MSAVEYHSVSGLHKLNHSIRICSRKPRSEQPRSSYSRGWVTPGYSVRARLSRSEHSVSPNPTPAAGNRLIILGESISRRGYSRFRSIRFSSLFVVRRGLYWIRIRIVCAHFGMGVCCRLRESMESIDLEAPLQRRCGSTLVRATCKKRRDASR